jgi:hypothetical protein
MAFLSTKRQRILLLSYPFATIPIKSCVRAVFHLDGNAAHAIGVRWRSSRGSAMSQSSRSVLASF